MYATDECKEVFLKKVGKDYADLSTIEKAILCDVLFDNANGRYSKFLQWDKDERNAFLKWIGKCGIRYADLEDAERWAYEDSFEYTPSAQVSRTVIVAKELNLCFIEALQVNNWDENFESCVKQYLNECVSNVNNLCDLLATDGYEVSIPEYTLVKTDM